MAVYRYSLGDGDSVIIDLPSGDELVVYGDESANIPLVTHVDSEGYETSLQEC